MDLQNFEGTSTYAIEAVYQNLWQMIPDKYKLPKDDHNVDDMSPFYDPELTFENRLHYKLTNIEFPKRANPWFIITWNTPEGIIKSSLTQRRFQTKVVKNKKGEKLQFKFINTELQINFGIVSNTLQGIYEMQENILLKKREKMYCFTKEHSILGNFPVSLDIIDSTQNKLARDKGTLCYLMLNCKIDYPIIGNVVKYSGGIIEEIRSQIREDTNIIDQPLVISRDTILPEKDF